MAQDIYEIGTSTPARSVKILKIKNGIKKCVKASCVPGDPGARSYIMSWPMDWFHEDPEHTFEKQITQKESKGLCNIYDLSSLTCHIIEEEYNLYTIGQLVDYIILHGFPRGIDFKERTKMVLSVRVANKFLGKN